MLEVTDILVLNSANNGASGKAFAPYSLEAKTCAKNGAEESRVQIVGGTYQ